MRISLVSQGNAAQTFTRDPGVTVGAITGSLEGKSAFLQRGNAVIDNISAETTLQEGDIITVVPNKRVGR
jgi:hypothetical protein